MKVHVHTTVQNGRISRNRDALAIAVGQFEGKEITITIQRKKKERSSQQNRYYWGVIIELIHHAIREAWGEPLSKDEIHDMMRTKYCHIEAVKGETGEIMVIPKSTTSLSTHEAEEYFELCRNWAAEWLGIEIPLPNEQLMIET